MESNLIFAFSITLLAGLATGFGSLIAFFAKKTNTTFLSASLGFSAGVMIYVSFMELMPQSLESLVPIVGSFKANWITSGSFFIGMLIIAIIDKFVPSFENPHTMYSEKELEEFKEDAGMLEPEDIQFDHDHDLRQIARLYRMGVMSALAIAIHNFPEGLATFFAAIKDPEIAIPIAIAIAIHNIPEGISVSVPIYYSTGSRKKAFLFSLLSGLAEPAGAIVGYLVLSKFFNDYVFGVIFGIISGIMVYISFDELLPASEEYGEHHISLYGLILGMIVMAVSLNIF